MRNCWKRCVGGTLLALLICTFPAIVRAHAELVGSEPADGSVIATAPDTVKLYFSEPIEPEFFEVNVFSSRGGSPIDRGDARISPTDARVLEVGLPEIGPGTYTVVWRALSLDSHAIRGVFAFTVGTGTTPGRALAIGPPIAFVPFSMASGVRWLTFMLAFVLLGGFAFYPLVLMPALRTAGLATEGVDQTLKRRWLILAWTALALLLVLTFVALIFQASSAASVPLDRVLSGRAVTRVLTATRFGSMWLVRTVLLVGLAGVLAWLSVLSTYRRLPWGLGMLFSALALLTISASGHPTAVQNQTAVAVLFDWTHLLAGGLWVGGLVQLALVLHLIVLDLTPDGRRHLLGSLVPRFSWLAGLSVLALVLTGVYAGRLYVPSWTALQDTAYGVLLSSKLVVFVPLLLLGAINLLVFHPRFRRAALTPRRSTEDAQGRNVFRWLVLGEIALALGVLAVTGMLTGTPPASSLPPEGKPFNETQTLPTYSATLAITPNQAGQNRLVVTLNDAQGNPVTDAQQVRLQLIMQDMAMAPREVDVRRIGAGRFEIEGGYLSMSGRWQAVVAIRRPEGVEQPRFGFVVGQPPDLDRPVFSPARIALNALNFRSFSALTAIAGGIFLWIANSRRRQRSTRQATHGLAGVLVGLGLLLGGTSIADAYRQSLPNLVPSGPASIARGEEIYQAECLVCHGARGRGDGPAAVSLNPRPADFRVHMAAGHTDPQLFFWVTNGLEGTAMPGFKDKLSEEDRWHVINFIRTFAPVER